MSTSVVSAHGATHTALSDAPPRVQLIDPWLSWGIAPVVVGASLCLHNMPHLPGLAALSAAVGLVAALLLGVLPRLARAPRLRRLALWAALALTVWVWTGWVARTHLAARLPPEFEGQLMRIVGTIDDLPMRTNPDGYRLMVRVEQCATESIILSCKVARVALSWSPRRPRGRPTETLPELRAGQRWAWWVRLKRPHAAYHPGLFDRELRNLQEQIGAIGVVRSGELLPVRAVGLTERVAALRSLIRDQMLQAARAQDAQATGVLIALAIGDQAAIDAALWTVFNRTGVGHLMSISGLHITMLAALAGAAAARLWRTTWAARAGLPLWLPVASVRLGVAVVVAGAYAWLAGWGIPAQRTFFMLMVTALLLRMGRAASLMAVASSAVLLMVLLDPWAPLTAGFWLSFGAVLAIVWHAQGQTFGVSRIRRFWSEALQTQWAATLALVPWGIWFFSALSVVGPLANALAIPVVSVVVTPLALLGGAVACFSTTAATWVLLPANWITHSLLIFLQNAAQWPGAAWSVAQPGLGVLLLTALGTMICLAPRGIPGRLWGSLALLPLFVSGAERVRPDELRLTALDVGQGTAVVVQVAQRVLIYDTGPSGPTGLDSGSRVLLPWLRARGISRPDAVVLSHQDDDHVGGAQTLLRSMPPDWLASSLPEGHPLLKEVKTHYPCRRDESWSWGEVHFRWLHPADPPEPARGSPTNAVSCVLRIDSPGGRVLLTGDIEAPQERSLLSHFAPADLRADILLVPHHGSKTSSTEAFIDAVSPRWALIQAGYRSRYGHPHPKVLARYLQRPITVLRNDADGAITLSLSPTDGVQVSRSRIDRAPYWRVPVAGGDVRSHE